METRNKTLAQYNFAIHDCQELFLKKASDYGPSWSILRPISITDQIFIKAYRVRTIQELKHQKVSDTTESEFIGIVNYCVIGLIALQRKAIGDHRLGENNLRGLYDSMIILTRDVMLEKNHDYGEAWRSMSQESFVDLILQKVARMKQIISNNGASISEGLDANLTDILNYAVFALITINESKITNHESGSKEILN